jgi:polyribonucleotide 5'-hydroxyl-kinase
MANDDEEPRQWTLEPMQEFRFEVDAKNKITIKISSGKAEIFGTELANDIQYHFTAKKLAIFSWHGCKLESSGKNVVEYIGKETPMNSIINTHFALQKIRQDASLTGVTGPRVMIVGPGDVGKSSLAKTLASYAARSLSFPILCDLDPAGVSALL